jgi:hypothetical protein
MGGEARCQKLTQSLLVCRKIRQTPAYFWASSNSGRWARTFGGQWPRGRRPSEPLGRAWACRAGRPRPCDRYWSFPVQGDAMCSAMIPGRDPSGHRIRRAAAGPVPASPSCVAIFSLARCSRRGIALDFGRAHFHCWPADVLLSLHLGSWCGTARSIVSVVSPWHAVVCLCCSLLFHHTLAATSLSLLRLPPANETAGPAPSRPRFWRAARFQTCDSSYEPSPSPPPDALLPAIWLPCRPLATLVRPRPHVRSGHGGLGRGIARHAKASRP